jgi:Uma2 family endonuclease
LRAARWPGRDWGGLQPERPSPPMGSSPRVRGGTTNEAACYPLQALSHRLGNSDMATTHLVTAEELLEMGGDAPYELWEGVLKEVSPSSSRSSEIALEIGSAILAFVKSRRLGHVTGEGGGYILGNNPYTVVAPDVGYYRGDPAPDRGFYPMPPDLAVEVISPTDRRADIAQKQRLYAQAGVPLVWWVDPELRTVTVHQPGQEPTVIDESGTLDGGDILPGFELDVKTIFAIG